MKKYHLIVLQLKEQQMAKRTTNGVRITSEFYVTGSLIKK